MNAAHALAIEEPIPDVPRDEQLAGYVICRQEDHHGRIVRISVEQARRGGELAGGEFREDGLAACCRVQPLRPVAL